MKELDADTLRDLNQKMLKASLRASRLRIFSVLFFALAAGGGYFYLQNKESEAKAVILAGENKLAEDSAKNAAFVAKLQQKYGPSLDSLLLLDTVRNFVNEYLASREKHDPKLLDRYHSDTLKYYFLRMNVTKAEARKLGADYWKKNPKDRFEPQLEPFVRAGRAHFIVWVKGLQCRKPSNCLPEILEIHVQVGKSKLSIDHIRAFYSDKLDSAFHP